MRSASWMLGLLLVVSLGARSVECHAQGRDSTMLPSFEARGQARSRVEMKRRKLDFVLAQRFTEARQRAARAGSQGSQVHVAADQETSYLMVVRTDSSQVEQHARWDDIVIVRSGSGGVSFGDRASGRRLLGPGEYRGGQLTRAHHLPLKPGDVARIPAGVPHQFWRTSPEPFEYMVVKVRRGDRPIAPP